MEKMTDGTVGGVVMTENEVLEYFKSSKRKNDMLGILPGSDIGNTIIKALEELKQYRTIGTVEECRAAVEMQTAISRELIEGKYFCPKCHNLMPYPGYCGCGQKVY